MVIRHHPQTDERFWDENELDEPIAKARTVLDEKVARWAMASEEEKAALRKKYARLAAFELLKAENEEFTRDDVGRVLDVLLKESAS